MSKTKTKRTGIKMQLATAGAPKATGIRFTMAANKATMNLYGVLLGDEDDAEEGKPSFKFGDVNDCITKMKTAGIKSCELNLNSPGGDVAAGLAIYDAIENSGIQFDKTVTGMAASMMTIVMLAGDKLPSGTKNSLYMFHRPKGGEYGDADKLRETADMIETLEAKAVDIYMEKLGIKEAEAKALMQTDKNQWFTAQEMLDKGWIAGIKGVGDATKKVAKPKATMSADDVFDTNYSPKSTPPTQTNHSNPTIMLNKKNATALKVKADADDNDINEAVANVIEAKEKAENDLNQIQLERKTEKIARAKALVAQAKLDKKITTEDVPDFEKYALENYEATEKMLNKIPGVKLIAVSEEAPAGEDDESKPENFKMNAAEKKMTMRQLERKNPKLLVKMKSEAPVLYATLYEEEYGVKPTK